MIARISALLLVLFFTSSLRGQEQGFVPNQGQWSADFEYFLNRGAHQFYFRWDEVRVRLNKIEQNHHHTHPNGKEAHPKLGYQGSFAYALRWIGAQQPEKVSTKVDPMQPKLNYLRGNNPARWKSGIQQLREIRYHEIYPGIDLRYLLTDQGVYRFDFIVHPGADPAQIQWKFEGLEQGGLQAGQLIFPTDIETLVYSEPRAFQGNEEVEVAFAPSSEPFSYHYELGKYKRRDTLVIDPVLMFATYSGSYLDNFGFAATYAEDGSAYGAGIVFPPFLPSNQGYPVTLGAFQDTLQGNIDIAISKYSADGTQQLYATYLGGNQLDAPYSLLEGPNKSLIVLGVTGSPNFPTNANGFDTSFAPGAPDDITLGGQQPLPYSSDIFISILDSTGGSLLGGTFFGDTFSDGNNERLEFNYGDATRGDITLDSQGNIIITSFTFSNNLPTGIANNSSYLARQDGLVASFSADLSQLNWARYLGGESNDGAFSLRFTPSGRLYVTGMTESDTINYDTTNVYSGSRIGGVDGFIAELNPVNGDVLKFTYTGSISHDPTYFIDYTPDGNLVLFGQNFGYLPTVGDSIWGQDQSAQYLQMYSPELDTLMKSTVFGNGINLVTNISPTALMVSDCGDIFISGWGATYSSKRGNMGRVIRMPVTQDAYRDSADGRGDFYFLRLSANWKKLEYASYFGQIGSSPDHVDGGSSRFRRDGSIFQAICSCGGTLPQHFPTTPNAYSNINNSGNCNMVVMRFDMQADEVRAEVRVNEDYQDSTCVPYQVLFDDLSFNADITLVKDPDGNVDTLRNQIFTITGQGVSEFEFVAIDTNCLILDTTYYRVYGLNSLLQADFSYQSDSCQIGSPVQFQSQSQGSSLRYTWIFGDGDTAFAESPSHVYEPGNYQVKLIVEDTLCGQLDSLEQQVLVSYRQPQVEFDLEFSPCDPLQTAVLRASRTDYDLLEWYLDDQLLAVNQDSLSYNFTRAGLYIFKGRAYDSICQKEELFIDSVYILDQNFSIQFPNVFTPNGDGLNEGFGPLSQDLIANYVSRASLQVYNRNGQLLFEGDGIDERWLGNNQGQDLPPGVYYYLFTFEDICGRAQERKGFVHLQR